MLLSERKEAQSKKHNECAQCGNALIAPVWSEYLGERRIRHLWNCEACGYEYETRVYLALADKAPVIIDRASIDLRRRSKTHGAFVMKMNTSYKILAVALMVAATPWIVAPVAAAPVSTGAIALKSAVASDVIDVRGGYGYRGYGYRGYGYRGYGYRGYGYRGYGYGIATGLALGAIAAPTYYYSDPYYPYYRPYAYPYYRAYPYRY
jgi:hypothetical protein